MFFLLLLFSRLIFFFSQNKNVIVYVAVVHEHNWCRYEQGLEDYEEAVARVDKIKENQQKQQQAYGVGRLQTALTLIETVSNVWNKVSNEFEQKQSTNADKTHDRPTTNNFHDGNDQNGKSRCVKSKKK